MYCFDCLQENYEKAAVAVCHHCGAGVCRTHLSETKVTISKIVPLGRAVPLPLKARRICGDALEQEER